MQIGTRTQNSGLVHMTHQEAIEKKGYILASPVSGSMRPLIRENVDFARFESGAKHKPRVGDVVIYHGCRACETVVVMHRIIGADGENYIIQGDNTSVREIVPKTAVFGVMTGYFRGSSYRSCRNPVFWLYSFLIITGHRAVYTYRTSQSFFCKSARFLWRRILHHRT